MANEQEELLSISQNRLSPADTYIPEGQPVDPNAETDEERQAKANEVVGFTGGFWNEWGTVQARMLFASPTPFDVKTQYEPTDEERKSILEMVDYNLDRYRSAIRGASSKEDLASRIGIIKDVQEYRKQQSMASLADNLASGFGGMFGDPTSYIPLGGATMAGRLALSTGSAVFNGYANEYISGDENDPIDNLSNAIMLGGTIEGFSKVRSKIAGAGKIVGDTSRRAIKTAKDIATNTVQDSKYLAGIRGRLGAINGLREKLEGFTPAITVAGVLKNAKSDTVRGLASKMFKIEEGTRTKPNEGVFKQYHTGKAKFTAEEYKDFHFNEGFSAMTTTADSIYKLSKELNMSVDDINHFMRKKLEGAESTPLDANPEFTKAYTSWWCFNQNRGGKLVENGMIDGKAVPKGLGYESRSFSEIKAADFLESFAGSRKEKIKAAVDKVSKALLLTKNDARYMKLFLERYKNEVLKINKKTGAPEGTVPVGKVNPATGLTKIQEKAFDEWMEKMAREDAMGIVDQNVGVQKGLYDDPENLEFNYRKTRLPWKITEELPDGFSVDRLQKDLVEVMDTYNRHTAADLGIYDAFAVTQYADFQKLITAAIEDEVKAHPTNAIAAKQEIRNAFRAMVNAYYGRSTMDAEDAATWANALSDSLRNFTFFNKNAFMGYMNHFETAEAIKAYGATFMIKSIPGLESKLNDWSKGGMSARDRRDIINNIFGMESKARGIWREIENRNLSRFRGDKAKAMLVSTTEWVATNSPFTRYLNASNESITDCARGLFLADLVRFSHGRGTKRTFFTEDVLERLDIDKEQFDDLLRGLKKGTAIDAGGRLRFKPKFTGEVEHNIVRLMTLRRLGDYVAAETILRPSLGDTFIWRGAPSSSFLNAAMQFKSFALRSYRKRIVKMANRIEEGDGLGQALTMAISGALGTMSFVGQTALNASGMNEEQRRSFFKNTMGVEELADADGSTLANVAINGSMRSSVLAFPSLIAQLGGMKIGIKSTSDQGIEGRDEAGQLSAEELLRSLVPGYNTVKGLYGIQADTRNLIDAGLLNPDEYFDRDRERYAKSFGRNLKAITPNIPLVQQGLINMITDNED